MKTVTSLLLGAALFGLSVGASLSGHKAKFLKLNNRQHAAVYAGAGSGNCQSSTMGFQGACFSNVPELMNKHLPEDFRTIWEGPLGNVLRHVAQPPDVCMGDFAANWFSEADAAESLLAHRIPVAGYVWSLPTHSNGCNIQRPV